MFGSIEVNYKLVLNLIGIGVFGALMGLGARQSAGVHAHAHGHHH